MKKALQIRLANLFGEACQPSHSSLHSRIPMSNGQCSYYRNDCGQACLQEFDGLLGYINLLDVDLPRDIVIPLHIDQADIHIFYLFGTDQAFQIKDPRKDFIYSISSGRGRYIYLPTGDYELYIPLGNYTVVNFYFRCRIFRDGNERPFQFLHPLIEACRGQDSRSCCSIDFRAGERTILLIKTIVANIKKGALDNEDNILWGIKKLINLSTEKIFDEYDKISESQIKAKAAWDLIKHAVERQGQDFKLETIADQLLISEDYLHAVVQDHYGLSPLELKMSFMLELSKKYIMEGMPIDQVAYELGYTAPSSFARFFKKNTGMTATEFFKRYTQDYL